MNGENRPLITDEPIEFEKQLVEVQDFRKMTHHFRRIYGIYLTLLKNNQKDHNM